MKLSIFTSMTNPQERNDPWKEALECYNDFADEVIMSLPKASRVAQSTNEAIYTFKDPRFRGKAVTEGLIQSLIKSSGAETKDQINSIRNSFDLYQAAKK